MIRCTYMHLNKASFNNHVFNEVTKGVNHILMRRTNLQYNVHYVVILRFKDVFNFARVPVTI